MNLEIGIVGCIVLACLIYVAKPLWRKLKVKNTVATGGCAQCTGCGKGGGGCH